PTLDELLRAYLRAAGQRQRRGAVELLVAEVAEVRRGGGRARLQLLQDVCLAGAGVLGGAAVVLALDVVPAVAGKRLAFGARRDELHLQRELARDVLCCLRDAPAFRVAQR